MRIGVDKQMKVPYSFGVFKTAGIAVMLGLISLFNIQSVYSQMIVEDEVTLEQSSISIYFNSDDDNLNTKSKSDIRLLILEIGSANIREIYIEGHADSDASDLYNQELSARRADNARQFLRKQGVKDKMIRLEFFGESKPLSLVKSENRRVVITFLYEPSGLNNSGNGKPILVINTYEAGSKQKLPCNFILDVDGQNVFSKTSKTGTAVLRTDPRNKEITFVKLGYLNESIIVKECIRNTRNDTAYIDVYLRPVIVLQKLRFENIFFYTDSDELKPESKPELDNLLRMLQQDPELYIEIQGHMNFSVARKATPAHRKYNLDLSHKRAKAVYNYLIANGISKSRLTYKGLSNFSMIYPDPQTREQEDMNKRVEVWTLQVLASSKS